MPYMLNRPEDKSRKFLIRFRGAAMIPRLNQMAPCRVELSLEAIGQILESLYRHPLRLEVKYVDPSKREWDINYSNYMKILPVNVPVEPVIGETPMFTPVEESTPIDNHLTTSDNSDMYVTNDPSITEDVVEVEDEDTSSDDDTITPNQPTNNQQSNNQKQSHKQHPKHRRK